jgi:hypothetical protein
VARENAAYISEKDLKAKVLLDIGAALTRCGEIAGGQASFLAAYKELRGVPGMDGRLLEVADAQARVGEFNRAWQTAESIRSEECQSEAAAAISIALAKAGSYGAAADTCDNIRKGRNLHLPRVFEALVSAGDRQEWKRLLIPCAYYLDSARRVCAVLAKLHPERATGIGRAVIELTPQLPTTEPHAS